jgi:hypothetical protein
VTDPGLRNLLQRIDLVEERVRALVAERRRDDPNPDDPFRGLYVSDEIVDRLLRPHAGRPLDDQSRRDEIDADARRAESDGAEVRLLRLARSAGLVDVDTDLLVIALVPDLDARYEKLYGYLNDDVTRRRATVGLALQLLDLPPAAAAVRARLSPTAALVRLGLLEVDDAERPFLTRSLRVPDRVTSHLLGDDDLDPFLDGIVTEVTPHHTAATARIARALSADLRFVHLRERAPGTGGSAGAAALTAAGRRPLHVDLVRLAAEPDPLQLVATVAREALLREGGIVAGPVDVLANAAAGALRRLAAVPVPVLTYGPTSWDPAWSDEIPLLADASAPSAEQRTALWEDSLGPDLGHLDPSTANHFVLGPTQVGRAVQAARLAAVLHDGAADPADLRTGARAQNAAGLERLARRIEPEVSWTDLVLPSVVLDQLHELAARARYRERVLTDWRMRPGGGRGIGVTALFAGDSGTGKTMSAEAIAAELGLDLYTVNLATVIDKYVGETEKNLERIFAEASGVNAVLLFDEADAIFGKRSEVRDAHDRYANIESAYLLQRMETFDGLAVLATNLRANIDDAFTRRLDAIIDFPEPSEPLRLELWQRSLAPPVPVTDDLDLAFCARAFALTGGNIRSIAITAAYRAAAAEHPVGMADLIAAVQQEYRKLGRLVVAQEFGDFLVPRS